MGKVYEISKMIARRKTKNAVFLGCGQSINSINKAEWNKIKTYDIWSINNWIYHPDVVPNFYHVELKHYDFPIFMEHLDKKRDKYRDCHFFCPENFVVKVGGKAINLASSFNMPHSYGYKVKARNMDLLGASIKKNIDEAKRIAWTTDANYILDLRCITKSYNISLTSVLEIMALAGYENIIMFGVDLKNSYYFWTGGDPKYGKVHHQTNKAHEGKNPELPHNTHIVAGYIVDFHKRHMAPNRNLLVGNKETLLYPHLQYKNILELGN